LRPRGTLASVRLVRATAPTSVIPEPVRSPHRPSRRWARLLTLLYVVSLEAESKAPLLCREKAFQAPAGAQRTRSAPALFALEVLVRAVETASQQGVLSWGRL